MTSRMKIVIGYDGSRCADSAINDLWKAGLPPEADAVVLTVAEHWLPSPSASEEAGTNSTLNQPMATSDGAVELAEFGAQRVKNFFPEWNIQLEVRAGSPAREILSKAEAWKANLIVVGSHGRSGLGRFFLGSVSNRILSGAPCSVRIARGQPNDTIAAVKLIVAMDGSFNAEKAARAIRARHWPEGSVVRLIAVQDPIRPIPVTPLMPTNLIKFDHTREEERAWIRTVVEVAAEELREKNLCVLPEVKIGDPRHVLVHESEEWKADCIFVGARGLGKLDKFLIGSVSSAVAMRAHCSVEIVR